MHTDSYNLMKDFLESYATESSSIIEIGSMDVNGSYRDISSFKNYTGVDIRHGKGVDMIVKPYRISESFKEKFDIVICGNVIEHVLDLVMFFSDITKLLKDGGKCCIITPTQIDIHRHPIDCFRILPDGLSFLFKNAGLKEIKITLTTGRHNDLIGVAEK